MNVLMLDDERISLAVLQNHVGKLDGARGIPFTHPSDALRWGAANEVDAAVIDFHMHEMDGLEFARRLRELPGKSELPILMVTGTQLPEIRDRAQMSGIIDVFQKPADLPELRARLTEILARGGEAKNKAIQ